VTNENFIPWLNRFLDEDRIDSPSESIGIKPSRFEHSPVMSRPGIAACGREALHRLVVSYRPSEDAGAVEPAPCFRCDYCHF
jgi:hypothetical protein